MQGIFTIYDSKAETCLPPFFSPNSATAIRDFEVAANDTSTVFYKHAADYTLFEIASWDDQTGHIEPHVHINLGTAITFRKALEEIK